MTNTTMATNELQLVESQAVREQYVSRVEVLNRVKELVMLSNDTYVTTEMVANYYDVEVETVKSTIKYHKEEIESDGYRVLKGNDLKAFKAQVELQPDLKFASSLAIIPRRAVLRIGMLLRDSIIANKIRTYLLNGEEKLTEPQKTNSLIEAIFDQGVEQDNNIKLIIDRLNDFNLKIQNIEKLEQSQNELAKENIVLKSSINDMQIEIVDAKTILNEINNKFKLPENEKMLFEILRIKFNSHTGVYYKKYMELYNALEDWTGIQFITMGLENKNIKEVCLDLLTIKTIEEFINGVVTNRIIKNSKGHWIDTHGYNHNNIEFERTKKDFGYCCAYCGELDYNTVGEHIIPQSDPKTTNIIYNIIPACKKCNASKLAKNASDWLVDSGNYTDERKAKLNEHWSKYYINLKNKS